MTNNDDELRQYGMQDDAFAGDQLDPQSISSYQAQQEQQALQNQERAQQNRERAQRIQQAERAYQARQAQMGQQGGGQAQRAQQPQQAQQTQQVRQPQQAQQPRQAPQQAYQQAPYQAPQGGYVSAADIAMTHPARKGKQNPYNQYSRGNVVYPDVESRGLSRGAKAVIIIVFIAVIAGLAAGAMYVYKEMRKAEVNADLHNMDEGVLTAIDNQLTGNTSFEEPFTILLLGSDERVDDPDMGARTDTIILVRVDPVNKLVSMVSIPRDTLVYLDGVGQAKINAAYYYGGPAGTIEAVRNLTGVDIDHYVSINFDGLVQLVDAIGGIDVYVDERIEDDDAGQAIVEAGDQHLDGEQALVLARSRDYYDGDYTRQANQRKVIMAIVQKVLDAPATELAGLVKASTGFIQTDSSIDFDWIYSLADQIRHNNDVSLTVNSTSLPSQPAYIGEVSYVIADSAGTAELMQIFLSGGDVSQPLTQSSMSTDIANVGGTYGPTGGYDEYYYDEDYYYYDDEPEASYDEAPAEAPAEDAGGEGGEAE